METIAAIATPPGRGAIAIVRASGPRVPAIAKRLVPNRTLRPHRATVAEILARNGALLDRGVAIFSPSPDSYTGEDVLELHVHGSPVVARDVLLAILSEGARLAGPGEFTRRAFLNGKLDASSAQAVADLIDAETSAAARAAAANLASGLRREVEPLAQALEGVLEDLAAAIDFPDEVADPPRASLRGRIVSVEVALRELQRSGEIGRLVREGATVAIVGPPNAGKSSLLNALLGEERALVSDVPGTTRDTIEETVSIGGVPVRIVDTAGIRTHADRLESAGIARTERALEEAQIALVVIDGSRPLGPTDRSVLDRTASARRIVFCNKADLGNAGASELNGEATVVGSVYDRATLASLRAAIAQLGWHGAHIDLSRPHLAHPVEIDAVNAAASCVARALNTIDGDEPVDLIARDVTDALSSLRRLSATELTEELLDGIFSRFCIGK